MNRIHPLSGQDILATQHVKRWHMVRTKRVQTLAEHLAVVAMLASKIADLWNDPGVDRKLLLEEALTHDAHEVEYGDPPSPAVRAAPEAHAAAWEAFWARRAAPAAEAPDEGKKAAADRREEIIVLADKTEALLFYLLEGEDKLIARKCEESVRKLLLAAPLAVGLWISAMVAAVKSGEWTPQPGSPLDRA